MYLRVINNGFKLLELRDVHWLYKTGINYTGKIWN